MKHFVCTGGCGGETQFAGVCQSEGCKKEGEPLLECNCEDGLHAEVNEKPTEEASQ